MSRQRNKGFSTPEVLVVLFIIGILSLAAVQVQKSVRTYQLDSISGLLASRLTEARLTALKYNRTATVKINATSRVIELWSADSSNQQVQMKTSIPIPPGIYTTSTSPTQVAFNSLGRNGSGAASTITLWQTSTADAKCISVSAVGIISTAWC